MQNAIVEYFNYIDGDFVKSENQVKIRSPFNNETVGLAYNSSAEDVEKAVESVKSAFSKFRLYPSYKRAELISRIVDGITEEKEEFARLISLESGKPIKYARIEVERAISTFTEALEESKRIRGEWLPLDYEQSLKGRSAIVRRCPIGPVLGITPFNFPLNLVAHKIAPALACGATIILKPSPQAPLTALKLARVIHNAGAEKGLVNVLLCDNLLAEKMISDERIKILTFTGSAMVGWRLRAKAGKKRVVLELGGNAGAIVHSDADIDFAAERCAVGAFAYAGQICISLQRIYVYKDIFEKFIESFISATGRLKMGDPFDQSTDIGPMISTTAADRALDILNEAVESGAKILAGGHCSGAFFEPTILTGVNPQLSVCTEEVFAPIVVVEKYDELDDALILVNNSRFGLQAGIFTSNISNIFKAYELLEVGGLIVNDVPTFRADAMPYGGWKDSGTGREGVRYAINEYTDLKTLVLKI
ncbi:MAG: aldehyde dehydrogenase family protein [Verrucomicrobiia bacterium]